MFAALHPTVYHLPPRLLLISSLLGSYTFHSFSFSYEAYFLALFFLLVCLFSMCCFFTTSLFNWVITSSSDRFSLWVVLIWVSMVCLVPKYLRIGHMNTFFLALYLGDISSSVQRHIWIHNNHNKLRSRPFLYFHVTAEAWGLSNMDNTTFTISAMLYCFAFYNSSFSIRIWFPIGDIMPFSWFISCMIAFFFIFMFCLLWKGVETHMYDRYNGWLRRWNVEMNDHKGAPRTHQLGQNLPNCQVLP